MSLETEACARRRECKNDPSLPSLGNVTAGIYLFVVPHPLKCVEEGPNGAVRVTCGVFRLDQSTLTFVKVCITWPS